MNGDQPARLPKIRIVDAVGALTEGSPAVDAADGRLVEFTLEELDRLLDVLGGEGLKAFVAYVRVLRKEPGPDGRSMLVVDEFSGAWVQQRTGLGRNAAYRAQNALEQSGLFQRIVSRVGQGARGKQRAVLSPELVLVPGGADSDVTPLRRKASAPGSRKAGTRETGGQFPGSQKVGTRETGGASQVSRNREPGTGEDASLQVSAGFPESGDAFSTGSTSSESLAVVDQLLSSDSGRGLLGTALLPALRRNPERVRELLHRVFNSTSVVERLEPLVVSLRLDGPRTQRPAQFVDYLQAVLTGDLDPVQELRKLKVSGRPRLAPDVLAERLVVGLVVGLGMRDPITAWGGWLHQTTRADWAPKPNWLLESFADQVARLDESANPGPTSRPRPGPASSAGVGDELPVVAAPGTRSAPARDAAPVELPLLDDAVIEEHFAAARSRFPFLCREGSPSAKDPSKRSLLVRMYLEDVAKEDTVSHEHRSA